MGSPRIRTSVNRLLGTAQRRWEQRSGNEMLLARQREAVALRKNGQLADAEVQLRLLTADLADRAGADHAATLSTSATHAAVLNDLGQHAEAVAEGQAALRSSTSALGADHPVTRELAATLARIDSQP